MAEEPLAHLELQAVQGVLESEEYQSAVEEHPGEPLPATDHPEGGLMRDGLGGPPELGR